MIDVWTYIPGWLPVAISEGQRKLERLKGHADPGHIPGSNIVKNLFGGFGFLLYPLAIVAVLVLVFAVWHIVMTGRRPIARRSEGWR